MFIPVAIGGCLGAPHASSNASKYGYAEVVAVDGVNIPSGTTGDIHMSLGDIHTLAGVGCYCACIYKHSSNLATGSNCYYYENCWC